MKTILTTKIKSLIRETIKEEVESKIKEITKPFNTSRISWRISWTGSEVEGRYLEPHKLSYFLGKTTREECFQEIFDLFRNNKCQILVNWSCSFKLNDGKDYYLDGRSFRIDFDYRVINREKMLQKLGL
jgi:hypothetical protein